MAPPNTDDFSKAVGDLLSDDFGDKKFVKSKFTTEKVNGGAIAFTTEASEKGGKFAGAVSAKWKHKDSGFSLDKVTVVPSKQAVGKVDFSLSKVPVSGVTVKCKTEPSSQKGSVTCEYSSDTLYAGLLVKADGMKYKSATADATMAYDGIQVGGKVDFGDSIKDVWVGIGYTTAKYFAAISAEKYFTSFSLDALVKPSKELTVACKASSDLKTAPKVEAAAAYKCNSKCTVKGKYSMAKDATLDGVVSYSALSKVMLVGGVSIPLASPTPKYGLGLTLG